MERLTLQTPVSWTDCLDMGGSRAYTRKAMLMMKSIGDSMSISAAGELLAVAFLVPDRQGRLELAMAVKPEAAPRMLSLCRLAHLTLGRFAETGSVIICHVAVGNRAGERMARLTGFSHADDTLWIFKGGGHGKSCAGTVRRRRQRRQEGGSRKPAAAAGGERSPARQPAD
ncbi:hypothetical protein B5P46_11820 [Rhizobium leguminosarum]|uniref:GNAT family N-acetyltransferase n=1 Tax=Rhizobium leguminosarum TaxID=384 RepID=A0A4Q1UBI2_RHILE|nr:hypothetical protein B5P46_11820 [Rhizobium leguminosarum]